MSEKRRPLFWEGSSKKDFKGFLVPVQKDMGVALYIATPQPDIHLVEKRLKAVLARYGLGGR